ncbi:unnamed protein product [Acanthoscelides obtectus]|nr:unnamed protein product [Acanthoscelides obtectus]CAK1638385.1 Protein toll [Acanthoscelides obtectus]
MEIKLTPYITTLLILSLAYADFNFQVEQCDPRLHTCNLKNDPSNCCCFRSDEYEFQCSAEGKNNVSSSSKFLIHAKHEKYLQVDCESLDEYYLDLLPRMDLGDVETFRVRFCPIPEGSLLDTLKQFNTSKVEHIQLQYDDGKQNNTITKNLFAGLHPTKYLDINYMTTTAFENDFLEHMPNLLGIFLDENNFTELTNFYKHTPELLDLHLSRNRITTIPDNAFANISNLKRLHLWSNKLKVLTGLTFTGLSNLGSLELRRNQINTVHPDTFRPMVNLTNISLRLNKLTRIPRDLFSSNKKLKWIDIGLNTQLILPNKLFYDLPELERVDLDSSNIEAIPEDIFLHSNNIQTINLQNNNLTTLPSKLFESQKNLTKLSLSRNKISYLPDDIFSPLRKLEELYVQENSLTSISGALFEKLDNLEKLDLRSNKISIVHPNGFSGLRSLVTLDLSNNLYSMEYDIPDFNPLQNCLSLETLKLSYNKIKEFPGTLMYVLSHLKEIALDHNAIEMIDVGSARSFFGKRVDVDLSSNQIRFLNFAMMKQIADMNESTNATAVINLVSNPLWCDCTNFDLVTYLNDEINPLVRSMLEIHVGDQTCEEPPEFRHIAIKELKPRHISCRYTYPGCPTECDCFRRPFDRSVIVQCQQRNLTSYPDMEGLKWWISQGNVMDVNLTGNFLDVGPDVNAGYDKVRKMWLSDNRISKMDWVPPKVQILALDNNRLQNLSIGVLNALKNDTNLTELTLFGNPWTCRCSNLEFQRFLMSSYKKVKTNTILCAETSKPLINQQLCKPTLHILIQIAVPVLVLLLFLALAAVIYYKYNHEIKVWLFSKNLCLWFVTEEELDKDKKYDIFISYSQKDEDFIVDHLLPGLESGPNPFKTCIHIRDWVPGDYIAEQVVKSVMDSRRTLVVLSNNFLESDWGKLEFRMAHQNAIEEGRVKVIVVKYGELDEAKLDVDFKAYIKTNTYVEWGKPWFWNKLR